VAIDGINEWAAFDISKVLPNFGCVENLYLVATYYDEGEYPNPVMELGHTDIEVLGISEEKKKVSRTAFNAINASKPIG
jgi:hypothetical protein